MWTLINNLKQAQEYLIKKGVAKKCLSLANSMETLVISQDGDMNFAKLVWKS